MGEFRWSQLSTSSRLAILNVTVQAIIVAALEGTLAALIMPVVEAALANGEPDNQKSADLASINVYVILFITSQLFAIYFLTDGVIHKNTIQILASVVLSACVVAYSLFQVEQLGKVVDYDEVDIPDPDRVVIAGSLYTMSAVALLGTLVSAFLAFKLYGEFGWQIYKKIGANPRLRTIYRTYQTLIMFMKMDFFFGTLFSVQYLVLVLERDDYEFYVTIIALVVTPIMLIVASWGLRQESRPIMYGFFITVLLYMVYFTFKLVTMYTNPTRVRDGVVVNIYRGSQKFLTFFGVIAIVMIVITFVNAILCYRNFGRGLKAHVQKQTQRTTTGGSSSTGTTTTEARYPAPPPPPGAPTQPGSTPFTHPPHQQQPHHHSAVPGEGDTGEMGLSGRQSAGNGNSGEGKEGWVGQQQHQQRQQLPQQPHQQQHQQQQQQQQQQSLQQHYSPVYAQHQAQRHDQVPAMQPYTNPVGSGNHYDPQQSGYYYVPAQQPSSSSSPYLPSHTAAAYPALPYGITPVLPTHLEHPRLSLVPTPQPTPPATAPVHHNDPVPLQPPHLFTNHGT